MTDTAYAIRQARPRDTRSAMRLAEATFVPLTAQIGGEKWLGRVDYGLAAYDGTLWLLETEKQVASMIRLWETPDRLDLYLLAVAPPFQGRGYARALLAFAEERARQRGFGAMRLQVPEKLPEMMAFYQRIGFAETSRRNVEGIVLVDMDKALRA